MGLGSGEAAARLKICVGSAGKLGGGSGGGLIERVARRERGGEEWLG